jgi:hypothetical protein
MLVTSADLWAPAPGTVVSWQVEAAGGHARPVDLSLNQRNHLHAALAGEPSVWMAAAFDVDGPVDTSALERAYRAVVARHSALQVGADVVGGTVRGVHLDPSSLRWTCRVEARTSTVAATRDLLRRGLDRACSPLTVPAIWPAAISRPGTSTIVLGLDHVHADAYSMAVLVDDLHTVYESMRGGGTAPVLPETSCFVSGLAHPPRRVPPQDDRLEAWHDFLRRHDHRLPTFPLPLGVAPGDRVAQRTEVGVLGDARLAEAVGAHSRRHGGTTGSAVLAALAVAVDELAGTDGLALLMPVQTRVTPEDHRSVGWLTTTVPLELSVHLDSCTGLSAGARAVASGRALAAVPLDQVVETATSPLVRDRTDVFMASYLDYRRLPGSRELGRRRAHHVSAPTLADDLQVWVSRTDRGLGVRVRAPDTAASAAVVSELVPRWRESLAAMAHDCPATPVDVTASTSGRRATHGRGP